MPFADEVLDNLHSIYVDQWTGELVIEERDRTLDFLKDSYPDCICHQKAEVELCSALGNQPCFPMKCFYYFEELLARYPHLSPKERENAIAREKKTVFLMQIGDTLSNGTRHDGQAPDYDDWALSSDILVHYPLLDCAMELPPWEPLLLPLCKNSWRRPAVLSAQHFLTMGALDRKPYYWRWHWPIAALYDASAKGSYW